MSRAAKVIIVLVIAGLAIGGAWYVNFQRALEPMTAGDARFHRVFTETSLRGVLIELEGDRIVRNADALAMYAKFKRVASTVGKGTYEIRPGMKPDELLAALRRPVKVMVRIPEGWWIARVAKRLEEKGVCDAKEYIELAHSPALFKDVVDFPLPELSLEGYLYPDTYDLPPMTGAKETIIRQLQAFESKVVPALPKDANILRVLTVASMVELEAGVDEERAKVAGVIENRLRAKQRLELDATVLYALQEWKNLGPGEVRKVKSPYNTYLNAGLPPGPIGSPSLKSIEGALKPDVHGYFFYVARPNRTHYFSATYPEHLAFIRKARAEWKAEAGKPQ